MLKYKASASDIAVNFNNQAAIKALKKSMESRNNQVKKPIQIVILGGGFGGIYTLKYLHKFFHKNSEVKLILVNRKNHFLFTPLLHEVATGSVSPENVVEPIREILDSCIDDFFLDEVLKVDLKNRIVKTTGGEILYDYLLIALGGESNFYGIPGASENSFTLKSLADAIRLKNHFIRAFEKASKIINDEDRKKLLRFVVVGGGPTGVELAAEMSEFFYETFAKIYKQSDLTSQIQIDLIQRGSELLPNFSPILRKKSLEVLEKKKVNVRLNSKVKKVFKDSVELETGEKIKTVSVIWAAGIKPCSIIFAPEPVKNESGQLIVKETLQLEDYPEVFALGDIAVCDSKLLPALAQVATKEAKTAAQNIKFLIEKKTLTPFNYKHRGNLVSLGQWMAVAEISGVFLSGRFTWWLWRTIYLSKLISWSKKVKVAVDWTLNLFRPRDISEF